MNKKLSYKGRRTKLNHQMQKKICDILANGNYISTACAVARIHQSQYFRWMEKGEHAKSGIYRDFYDAVKEAEQVAEVACLHAIRQDPAWQAKAWVLERRFPERWGRKDRLEANIQGSVQVQFVPVEKMTIEEWNTKIVNPETEALPDPAEVN